MLVRLTAELAYVGKYPHTYNVGLSGSGATGDDVGDVACHVLGKSIGLLADLPYA